MMISIKETNTSTIMFKNCFLNQLYLIKCKSDGCCLVMMCYLITLTPFNHKRNKQQY
ncbi:Hypothetical predicted protein, partial [Scomber scombrus]